MRNLSIPPTLIENGIEYYRNKDAQAYTNLSPNGLNEKIKKFNLVHRDPVKKIKFGEDSKAIYFRKSDLDRLFELHVIK